MDKIKIGIVGYGNLGRGVEKAIKQNPDMKLEAIFTRRDVMILCGGSATDLEEQGPMIAEMFNTVDSFDTHGKIPKYFEQINSVSKESKKLSIISVGWDPGLFSLNRLLGQIALPEGNDFTFWGTGVSQGHSDALRRIIGVSNAIQYTVPVESALEKVRNGENPTLTTREKHKRECYIVAEEKANLKEIEETVKNMPNYFLDYDTTVNFISEEEMKLNHSKMPHGGFVVRTGVTGDGTKQKVEFSLELGSNPEFTSSVLVAYARAIYKLANEGKTGACTVLDIPYSYLSQKTPEELRKELL